MFWWIFSIAAACLLAVANILEKKYLNKIHALEFTTELSFYGFIFSLVFIPWVQWQMPLATFGLIALNGLFWSLAFLFFNKALRHGEASEVVPLGNLKVITTLIFAVIVIADVPDLLGFVGILLIFFGAYLIELKPRLSFFEPLRSFTHSRHLLLLLLSVTLYGITGVLTKIILEQVSVMTTIFFLNVFLLLGYIIIDSIYHKDNITKLRIRLKDHGFGVFWTALVFFVARININLAFTLGSVVLVTAVLHLNSFLVVVSAGTLLHEKGLTRRLAASGFIILGVLFTIIKS